MMVGQITGESIKSAIAKRIVENFTVDGKLPTVYKEQILQGFKKPSFFVWTIEVSQEKQMNDNYKRSYQMNVRYHASEGMDDLYEHLCSIGTQLLECLCSILLPATRTQTDGTVVECLLPVNGKQMDFKISDDVLQVYTTYEINVKKQSTSAPVMGELELKD